MYIKTAIESTTSRYRIPLLMMIIVGIGVLLLAMKVPARAPLVPLTPWRIITLDGTSTAEPLARPTMLADAVIWRPLGDSALVYSHLSGSTQQRHDWLRSIPARWDAWASSEAIHMVWLDIFGGLWSALLTPKGEQISAPIEVATESVADFEIIPLPQERLGVFWLQNGTLRARIISADGRPLSTQFLRNNVSSFAAVSQEDVIHMAWRDANQILAGDVTLNDELVFLLGVEERLVIQLDIAPDAWLSSLEMLLADDRPGVLWGITQAAAPDRENYEGFVLTDPDESSGLPFTLTLPDASGLRWASIQGNRVALAAYIDGDWQPVVVEVSAEGPQGFQVIDGPPVTGSPIGFWGDHFAWVTVDIQGQPQLYVTTLDEDFGTLTLPADRLTWREAIREGLRASPRLIFWLMAPVFVLMYRRDWWYALPLATLFYWTGKWVIQQNLFGQYPAALDGIGIQSGFLSGLLAFLGIQVAALAMGYVGWGRTAPTIRHVAYFLTDAVLTYAIFGAAVE